MEPAPLASSANQHCFTLDAACRLVIIIEIKIIVIIVMMIRIKIIEENGMGRRGFFILNGDRLKNVVKLTVLKRQI